MNKDRVSLTIFGGERCVTTLGDLEAAATHIAQKAARAAAGSPAPPLITYPGRPVQGGRLDVVPEDGSPCYLQRRVMLESLLGEEMLSVFAGTDVPMKTVCLTPTVRIEKHETALAYYKSLRQANVALGCAFFEGVVMKQAG